MKKNKPLVLMICLMLIFTQGCGTIEYIKRHPYKSLFVATGIAAIGYCVYAMAESGGGGGYSAPAQSIYVPGYYRADGTYVRPHYRTLPDDSIANNYGYPSYKQIQQYSSYEVIPTYLYDYDGDGITNQYDYDDDNDGIFDNYDNAPYNPDYY